MKSFTSLPQKVVANLVFPLVSGDVFRRDAPRRASGGSAGRVPLDWSSGYLSDCGSGVRLSAPHGLRAVRRPESAGTFARSAPRSVRRCVRSGVGYALGGVAIFRLCSGGGVRDGWAYYATSPLPEFPAPAQKRRLFCRLTSMVPRLPSVSKSSSGASSDN